MNNKLTKRKRLEEQLRTTQGKEVEGEHAHNISRNNVGIGWFTIVIFICSFLRSALKKMSLLVSKFDSRISICLHSPISSFAKSFCRPGYVHLL